MAKLTKPLTNTEVKQSSPKDKEYNLSDCHGLALRIKPNGSKLWIMNYQRPVTKKRANLSLGQYPSISLADARKLRTEAKKLVAKNIVPNEYLLKAKSAPERESRPLADQYRQEEVLTLLAKVGKKL